MCNFYLEKEKLHNFMRLYYSLFAPISQNKTNNEMNATLIIQIPRRAFNFLYSSYYCKYNRVLKIEDEQI